MSVLIRGMEMPTSCVNCRFSGFGGLRNERVVCMHTGSNAYVNAVQYLDDCPLVPVPPHGRLIDADALIIALETQDYSCAPDTLEEWTPMDMTKAEIADIRNAPTIIEGEDS